MIGDTFKKHKETYSKIQIPDAEITKRWQLLADRLPEQDMPTNSFHLLPYGALFMGVFVMLLVVTISLAQAAKPGSLLYPMHTVTQEIARGVSGMFFSKEQHVESPFMHASVTMPKQLPKPTAKLTVTPSPALPEDETKQQESTKVHEHTITPTPHVLGTYTKNDIVHTSIPENSENITTLHESQKQHTNTDKNAAFNNSAQNTDTNGHTNKGNSKEY